MNGITAARPAVLALRVLVGVSACCGLLALSSVLLLPGPLVAMELVLTLSTSWTAPLLARRIPSVNARLGCALGVQVAVMVLGAPSLRPALDAVLAPLAALLLSATAVEHTGVRQLVRGMWLGDACLLLAVGVEPDPVLAVPVVLAIAATGAGLIAATMARDAEAATGTLAVLLLPGRPGRRGRALARWAVLPVVASLLVALVGGLGLALLAGAGPYGPHGPAAPAVFDFGFSPAGGNLSRVPRATAGYTSGTLDMRARGELPEDPLFVVPADSPGLWRSNLLDSFDGTIWRNSWHAADGGTRLVGSGDVQLAAEPDDPPDLLARPATYQVRVLTGRRSPVTVIAPGPVDRLGPDVRVYRRSDGRLWVGVPPGGPLGYQVTSYPRAEAAQVRSDRSGSNGSAADGSAVGSDEADDPRWLQLPDDLPQRVLDLARQLTAGAPDHVTAVRRVENHLRENYSYQLDSPLPARGQDAVDHFLFEARTGFCEHFAAAEVLLLRAVGIPARIATGFGGGSTEDGARTLHGYDAHAWAEVWLPGSGWSSSDPTAGAPLVAGVGQRFWASARNPVVRVLAWLLVAVAGLATLLAIGLAVRLGLRRRAARATRRPVPAATAPLLVAFGRLEVALRRAGQERPPWETLAALADRLPDPPGENGAAAAALAVLERALYGPVPPGREAARAAAEVLDRVSALLLAEAQRRHREAAGVGLSRSGPGGSDRP